MSLGSALSIASSGLYAIQGQIAVVSQNVANANSPGYTEEVAPTTAVSGLGQGDGVKLGVATRVTAPVLQTSLYAQNASVSSQTVLNNALSAITSVEGSTDSTSGSTGSLTDLLSNLQAGLTTLQADPSNSAQQQTVLQDAQNLASGINSLANTYETQRQAASDAIASGVASANQALTAIGSLSSQIVSERAMGQSTAGLEDQRAAAMTQLSDEIGVTFSEQPNGSMLVTTTGGAMLPTNATSGPLSYSSVPLTPSDSYDGTGATVPNITLDGQNVTALLTGGALGANIALRDRILPAYTAQLDSFAATVSQRLSATGLPLFTDAGGAVPPATAAPPTGFSSDIQVNPSASVLLAGGGTGGISALSALINNVNNHAFGDDSDAGTPWPSVQTSGLGANGSLSLPYSGTGQLSDFASALISSQGADAQNAQTSLGNETAVQTALTGQISNVSSVSIDSEMSKMVALQNSYEANAKVVTAVQAMYSDILNAVDAAA